MNIRKHVPDSGLSLVELLVLIGAGALLAAIAKPAYEAFENRARKAKCISHMRTIHTGFSAYLADKGHWPQMEEGEFNFSEEDFFRFWVTETEPYGLNEDTWICPTDRKLRRELAKEGTHIGSYVPTRFDKNPSTPYRWNQPWVMERGNFHGDGAHVLMPDGSVQDSQNPFYGR